MISYHGVQRVMERVGLTRKQSEHFISNALKRGKTAEEFMAKERAYLRDNEAKSDCRILVYQSFFFIVDASGRCVTMYTAPMWFGRARYYDGKVKISNIKKYMRFHDDYNESAA